MFSKTIYTLSIFLFLLSSCKPLVRISSFPEGQKNDIEYHNYNSESRIRYEVSNDQDHIHIKLNTSNPYSIIKIFRTGLQVYFDIEGKKKETVFLQYPEANTTELETPKKDIKGQKKALDYNAILLQTSKKATYIHREKTEIFTINQADHDIKVKIEIIGENELIYDLIIPIQRFTDLSIDSIPNLAIGIVSGAFERANNKENQEQYGNRGIVNRSPAQQNPMLVNNRYGNRQPGYANHQQQRPDESALNTAINFWFKVNFVTPKGQNSSK